MVLQLVISYAPLLALVYALFALVQALRHKKQGFGALLLALVVLIIPLVAYFAAGAVVQELMLTRFALGALVVFVASLLVGLVERRNKARTPGRSYGMVGIGVSVVLALAMFVAPVVETAVSGTEPTATAQAVQNQSELASGDDTFVNVALNTSTDTTNAQATPAGESETTEPTQVARVLTEQTGLTADEVTAQAGEGSTLAELVAANEGDLDAVVEAIAAALDEMTAAGGMQAQMLQRAGRDTTEIATQFVNGEMGQAQNFLLPILLTGEMPQFGGNGGGAPPADGSFTPPEGFEPPSDGSFTPPEGFEPPSDGSFAPPADAETTPEARDTAPQSTPEPAASAEAVEESEAVIRPTRIAFPTATPTPEATAADEAEATEESGETSADAETVSTSASNSATCVLVVDYNLNLRDQPTQEGSTVLVSIPFGTTVNANAVTEDGWYSVSYAGETGWVTGEYVTAASTCASLPVSG
jgi:cellobiose-specific phosphotransferase system component IIA